MREGLEFFEAGVAREIATYIREVLDRGCRPSEERIIRKKILDILWEHDLFFTDMGKEDPVEFRYLNGVLHSVWVRYIDKTRRARVLGCGKG